MIVLENIWGDRIDEVWPLLEPCFEKAVEAVHTEWTTSAILTDAHDRKLLLWAIYRRESPVPILAAAASSIRETKGGKTAVIEHIGGTDMQAWLRPALEKFERLAREHGCTRLELEGRMGWLRVLPGFTAQRIVLGKTLT